jgi:hypothetical protein
LIAYLGSSAQQLAVIEQTATWALRHNFPADETRAAFNLGSSAPDPLAAVRLEPMIRAYLESETVSTEILRAAIWPVRRMRLTDPSRILIQRAMNLVQATGVWESPQTDLVRQLAVLVTPDLDEGTRVALGGMLTRHSNWSMYELNVFKTVKAAIVLAAVDTIEPIRVAILSMKAQR